MNSSFFFPPHRYIHSFKLVGYIYSFNEQYPLEIVSYELIPVSPLHNTFPTKSFIKQKSRHYQKFIWQLGYLLFLKPHLFYGPLKDSGFSRKLLG